MAKRHPDNTADGPEFCRLHLVTFSGGRAGWPLEPTQALEGDVSSFQDTFINLPLILQAGEITLEFNSLRMFLCTVNRFLNQAACLITDADSNAADSRSTGGQHRVGCESVSLRTRSCPLGLNEFV